MSLEQIGAPFVVLDQVNSTNDFAMEMIKAGKGQEGMAYFAKYQTEGKGQRGKTWFANPGDNINLSVVLQPDFLSPKDGFVLNALVSLAVYDFWQAYAGAESTIKWSNDIFWKNRKAGGILFENLIRGNNWQYAVVGIGINLNQQSFPKNLPNPVSLRQITGQTWEAENMSRLLCQSIEERYLKCTPLINTSALLEEYHSHLYRLNETALFRMQDDVIEACIRGVEKDGRLILERKGKILRVGNGEVKMIV